MKNKKVIKINNLPTRLPFWQTLTTYISLDYFNAPQWLWGALGLFFTVLWIVAIVVILKEKQVDIFNDTNKNL